MFKETEDMSPLLRSINRHGLWKGVAWGITIMALIDGSTYAVRGNKVATGPSYAIIREQLPGGLKFYGVIMLAIACLIIYATARESANFSRKVMLGVFIFSAWMTSLTVAGWIYTHSFAISGLSKWFLILWLSLWLAATVPKGGGRGAT